MICRSDTGEVSSSSMVPERFSSAYARMVIIGSRKRLMSATFCSSGRIMDWLMLIGPPPICDCMLCCTKYVKCAMKK